MSDKKIILIAFYVAFVLLLVYVLCFIGMPISNQTSDWGAFGSYAVLCVNSMSIALIYVTYREQRKTNEITRVEQHIVTMANTLVGLSEKYHEEFDVSCDKFSEHFKCTFNDMDNIEYNRTVSVCKYYYSSITNDDTNEKFDYFFRYMQLCIDYILNEKSLSIEDKNLRITEFRCIFPESIRILLFGWLLINNKAILLEDYYKSGIFMLDETRSSLLKDVITFVCTNERPQKRHIPKLNIDDIILDYNPNEQFSDTYVKI